MPSQHLVEQHRLQAALRGPAVALRYKRHGLYHDLTWADYRDLALACAAALIAVDIQPGDRVGVFSENRLEWLLADMGILTAGAVNVTPHAPLAARQVQYELADSGVRWLFVSNAEQRDKIAQVADHLPDLRGVVVFDRAAATSEYPCWEAFLAQGRHHLPAVRAELTRREAQLTADSLATIMYTSGTTGHPKGVMLTHGNLLSNVQAVLAVSPRRPGDVVLSWLPYSHIYARTVDHYSSLLSVAVTYLAESPEVLVQNLAEVQPTHMNSVPRFYEKVHALAAHADPAVTAKRLQAIFGPRIEFLSSGGAPLPLAVAEAYRDAGLLVLQGYGLTETSPVISFNTKEHCKLESVGRPIPGVEVRIAEDGEVLTRGPHVMKGYWKKPLETSQALREGWFHTGDLGRLDADGYLYITGRKKDLLVLSNGKKVVPSYLEGLLVADPCIDQAVIYGEGRNFLTALLVPNWDHVRATLGTNCPAGPAPVLAQHPVIYELLAERVDNALADVGSWEQVRKFVVLPEPFSQANEEMTVTMKLRRAVVFARHAEELEQLYHENGTST